MALAFDYRDGQMTQRWKWTPGPADNIAGKTALPKTGRDLAVTLLTYLDQATQPDPQAP